MKKLIIIAMLASTPVWAQTAQQPDLAIVNKTLAELLATERNRADQATYRAIDAEQKLATLQEQIKKQPNKSND